MGGISKQSNLDMLHYSGSDKTESFSSKFGDKGDSTIDMLCTRLLVSTGVSISSASLVWFYLIGVVGVAPE